MKKHKQITSLILTILIFLTSTGLSFVASAYNREDDFDILGDAVALEDGTVELTPLHTWKVGGAWYKNKVNSENGIRIEFSYWVGGGRDDPYGGADGFVVLFANNTYNLGTGGGYLGFVKDTAIGIEFDSYKHNSGDPNGKHIALVKNAASNHLKYVMDNRTDDSQWHDVVITLIDNCISVILDNEEVLEYNGLTNVASELYVGIAASTGDGKNRHLIRNFLIRKGEVKNGFDLTKDSWPVRNTCVGFGYNESYYIPHEIYTETLGNARGKIFELFDDGWGGNCFGMSLSSVLNYNNQVDFSPFFSNSHGKTLNYYGYIALTEDKKNYTLSNDRKIVSIIEKMQISQNSSVINSCKKFSSKNQKKNLSELIEYLKGANVKPLVMCIQNGLHGHALVIETKYQPIPCTFNGNDGFYAIKVYDCNYPYDDNRLTLRDNCYDYAEERYVFVNPDTGEWYYHFSEKDDTWWGDKNNLFLSSLADATITFYDPSLLNDNFIEKRLDITPLKGQQRIFINTNDLLVSREWKTIFEVTQGELVSISDELIYTPKYSFDETNKHCVGMLTLNSGLVSISRGNDLKTVFVSNNGNTVYTNISDGTEYKVDSENNQVEVNLIDKTSFDIILSNNDSLSIRIYGKSNAKGFLNLNLNDKLIGINTDIPNLSANIEITSGLKEESEIINNCKISLIDNQNILSLDVKSLTDSGNIYNDEDKCNWCGKVHDGFWGKLIKFIHLILSFLQSWLFL